MSNPDDFIKNTIINRMDELSKKSLTERKRISLELPESLVNVIDELARLNKPIFNRKQMIESIIRSHPSYEDLIKKCEKKIIQNDRMKGD